VVALTGRAAANLLKARRVAVKMAKLPELLKRPHSAVVSHRLS
jgi:hypothetical protein